MLMQNGLKMIGLSTPSKLIISCAGIVGGGIVLSLTTSELSSQQISSAFSSAYRSVAGLFLQNNQQNKLDNESPNNFFGSFSQQIKNVFKIVSQYFEPIFDIFKKPWQSLESLFKNLKNNNHEQKPNGSEINFDSRSLWNGALTLLGFKYRNIFEVEFGTFLYFLFNALFGVETWNFLWGGDNGGSFYQNWIDSNKWKKALEETKKFETRFRGFLFLLWNIDELRKSEEKNINNSNREKRKLSRQNMLAWSHSSPWVTNSIMEENN
ncbi:hypothetical protein PRV_00515 [Mycoplasma parvum str. Indiana]|uniref:Uncharacterized protein n=2 Tax=Mycoplasma parvum TaxID=984991 RepID=U5NBV9_9MOLU|nr:hypothetical protein PRV_00515 [Mycoplasma parvum str. Indiana]